MSCLNPYLTILDQVSEPLLIHEDISREKAEDKAIEMMKKVGIRDAEKRARSYPHEFSGGMRQRVMIAMALVTSPNLLLADEPTTALDVTVQAKILGILKSLKDDLNLSVLFVTHDLGVVAEIADRIVVMYRGKIVEEGTVSEIFNNPKHPYVKGLLACRPSLDCKYQTLPLLMIFLNRSKNLTEALKLKNEPQLMNIWKVFEQSSPDLQSSVDPNQTLLRINDLKVHFTTKRSLFQKQGETIKAIDGIDLKILRGQTLGLVGESGCGKTTTGRAILQLIRPTKGTVEYDGQELSKLSQQTCSHFGKECRSFSKIHMPRLILVLPLNRP